MTSIRSRLTVDRELQIAKMNIVRNAVPLFFHQVNVLNIKKTKYSSYGHTNCREHHDVSVFNS